MSDYVINIDTSYTDTEGNNLIESNDVVSVFYYDATETGSSETWHYNYGNLNVISDPTFNTVLSGTVAGWTYTTNGSIPPYKYPSAQYAGWGSTNLLESKSLLTSSGLSSYGPENLNNFRSTYGWRTLNATSNVHRATFDLGAETDFNYLYLVPGFEITTANYLKDYRVGISNSTTDSSFTIVASGTTVSGINLPEIKNIGSRTARYVRLYADTNWGGASYISVDKMAVFEDPDWSMFGYVEPSVVSGTYGQWEHTVTLDQFDNIYFDFGLFISNTTQNGTVWVYIDSDLKYTYNWASISSFRDILADNYYIRREEEIDVSSYTGSHTLKFKYTSTYGIQYFDFYVDNIYGQPGWFREEESDTRGSRGEFPNEVYVTSDRAGVSIIDKSDNTLWMRFNVGSGYALESIARDVYADEGKVYMATSRGLVVVDFTSNKIWKYTTGGIYYRMGIKYRNQYGYWFLSDASKTLATNDTYCVSCGTDFTVGYYTVVGTAAGLTYIKDVTTVSNSSFKYNVSSVKSYGNFIQYVGGKDKRSIVGVIDSITSMSLSNFSEDIVLYSNTGTINNNSFSNSVGDGFVCNNGNLPIRYVNGELTISGSKTDIGNTVVIQKDLLPSRRYTATADVKIKDWPDRPSGGFHFGVTDGWPASTSSYYDNNHSVMISATNSLYGPYIENESFSNGISDKWNIAYGYIKDDGTTYQSVTVQSGSLNMRARLSASDFTTSMLGPVVATYTAFPSCPSFIAKIKARITSIPTFTTDGERVAMFFGVSNGSYLGEGATGSSTMGLACYKRKGSVDTPVYCVGYKTLADIYSFTTTPSGVLFSGDGTSSASYHIWEISYDSASKKIDCSVDGSYVGTRTDASFGTTAGIFFGCIGSYLVTDYSSVQFKDFEIDFGDPSVANKNKYILNKNDGGTWTKPSSGGNLTGVSFWGNDGTSSADWRTWSIVCSGTTVSGSIDGNAVGSPQTLSTGDQRKIFFAYDMPTTVSGSNDVEVKIKNFTLTCVEDEALSGLPNNTCTVSGISSLTEYLTVYVATSSGVEQLKYLKSSPISNTPITKNTLASTDSTNADYSILYGNVNNVSSVEAEEDTVGMFGLLYAGTNNYTGAYWKKLVDRPGLVDTSSTPSLGVTASGSRVYCSSNSLLAPNSLIIYEKDFSNFSRRWRKIGAGEVADGLDDTYKRLFINDVCEDGNIYVLGATFFSYFNNESGLWYPSNYGTGPAYTTTETLGGSNTTVVPNRKELAFGFNGYFCKFRTNRMNWDGSVYDYSTTPDSGECGIAYSDVDDSYYMLTFTNGGFYRLRNNHRRWETLTSISELAAYAHGTYMFYRPYDECIYVLLRGSSDLVGRKIHRWDVKSGVWDLYSDDFPETMYEYTHAAYAPKEDCLYVIAGDNSASLLKYSFARTLSGYSNIWDPADGYLPENSIKSRFRKISPSSGEFVKSDTFTTGTTSSYWFDYLSHGTSITNITESTEGLSILVDNDGSTGVHIAGRSQCCCMPAADFTVTMNVKINSVPTATAPATINTFFLGVSDHLSSAAYDTDLHTGESYVGNSGLWMIAYSSSTVTGKYSVWKRESGDDTRYHSTLYRNFSATDATASATYRAWKIVYSNVLKRISCYIDNVLVGTALLSDRGFEHGMMLSFGGFVSGANVSGQLDVDVKDFVISTGDSVAVLSDWMTIADTDDNGYIGYEKYDQLLSSGTDYALRTEWTINTFNIYGNCYVNTLGSVSDGHREASLMALYNGRKRIGLYTGGDPRYIGSYTGVVEYDWTSRTKFNLQKSNNTVNVYLDDNNTPAISSSYFSMPKNDLRKVSFGTLKHHNGFESTISDLFSPYKPVVSGSWIINTDYAGASSGRRSLYSRFLSKSGSSGVNNKIIYTFNTVGDVDVFVYYPAATSYSTDVPFTVYHEGVVTLPVADAYASSSINTVYDNTDEYSNTDANATTITINQARMGDGTDTTYPKDIVNASGKFPSGFLYIGTYTNVSRVVQTCDCSSGTVAGDTVKIQYYGYVPRSKSSSRVHLVSYTVGSTNIYDSDDNKAAFSIVDLSEPVLVDYYNTSTDPAIIGDDINATDVS